MTGSTFRCLRRFSVMSTSRMWILPCAAAATSGVMMARHTIFSSMSLTSLSPSTGASAASWCGGGRPRLLLPSNDRLGRRQLSAGEMLVWQALALLYLDPADLQHGELVAREVLLQRLAGLVGMESLVRTLNPRRKKFDERVAAGRGGPHSGRGRALSSLNLGPWSSSTRLACGRGPRCLASRSQFLG